MARRKFTAADIEINAKDKTKTGVNSAKKSTGSLTDAVKRYGAEMAAVAVVVAGAIRVMKDLTEAYFEQERAIAGMEAALQATGTYTPGLSLKLQDLASELQKVTIYGDETTLAATGMLQSLAKLSDDGLMQAIPLVQELATGMKIDLITAASLMGKTLGSSTNALSRYGIVLDATAPASEKLVALTEQITGAFGGMSQAAGETAAGSMVKLDNAVGDLKETGGKAIAVFLQPGVKWLTQLAEKAKESFDHFVALNNLFTESGWAEATGDIELARRALEEVNEQLKLEKEALEKGMRLRGMTRREAEESIVGLQNKAEGLRRTIINLGRASGGAGDQLTAIGNIWTDIYDLPDYPAWLRNLYEATDQAQLDALWVQMERAQANLVESTGEEARQLEAVIGLLREKILAMSEYVDEEQRLIDLMGKGGEARGALTSIYDEYGRAIFRATINLENLIGMELRAQGTALAAATSISTMAGAAEDAATEVLSIKDAFLELQVTAADWARLMATTVTDSVTRACSAIGLALANQEIGWDELGQTALKILADILRAIGAQLAAMVVVLAIQFRWVASALALAGSIAAFAAAALIERSIGTTAEDAYADLLVDGDEFNYTDGSTQTVTKPPDIYNTFNFNGTFIETSWQRFVDMITAEQERQKGLVVIEA